MQRFGRLGGWLGCGGLMIVMVLLALTEPYRAYCLNRNDMFVDYLEKEITEESLLMRALQEVSKATARVRGRSPPLDSEAVMYVDAIDNAWWKAVKRRAKFLDQLHAIDREAKRIKGAKGLMVWLADW